MRKVQYFDRKSVSLIKYSRDLAKKLYEGIIRQSGEAYFKHPEKMAHIVDPIIRDPLFKVIGKSAAYLHDIPEERPYIEIFDSIEKHAQIDRRNKIFLNDFLFQFGKEGDYVSYIVNRLTHGKERYSEYMKKILSGFHRRGNLKKLDMITAIIKMADRYTNIEPKEKMDTTKIQEEYSKFRRADRKALEKFYNEMGPMIIDAFIIKGSLAYDPKHIEKALGYKFQGKQTAAAIDNLINYVPMAESSLLAVAKDEELYSRKALKKLLKETMINSFQILEDVGLALKFNFYTISDMGFNRADERELPPSYIPILEEIRQEAVEQRRKKWAQKHKT